MSTYFTNRTLGKSANFAPSASKSRKSNLKTSVKGEAKTLLSSSALENIEIEYIKNLQQQVHFLELECNYLRQQLNQNGLLTQSKYDQQSKNLRNEMISIQSEKQDLEKSLLIENYEKESVQNMLEQTASNFDKERNLLLAEIATLKNQKLEAEEKLLNKNVELTQSKKNMDSQNFDIYQSLNHLNASEAKLESVRRDNLELRAEINEARNQLISRDNLIKEMQAQLADPEKKFLITNELKTRNENDYLKNELLVSKQKISEITRENQKLSTSLETSLKQNEDDLLMAKKNLDLSKTNANKLNNELENNKLMIANLKTQIEQYKMQEKLETKNQNALKKRISELEGSTMSNISVKENLIQNLKDQLKSKQNDFDAEKSVLLNENNKLLLSFKNFETKINELNDIIDKNQLLQKTNLEGFKSKEAQLQIQLDETALNLKNEMNTNQNLELKIESLQRQDQIYTNMIASLKTRISELEIQLQDYSINQPDLKNKLIEANEKINNLEEEKQRHLSHIELLNTKLNDVDRLKNLENMVQSQRWNELGQLAESMKTLSQNMGTTGSLLNQSLTNTALDESLKNSLKF